MDKFLEHLRFLIAGLVIGGLAMLVWFVPQLNHMKSRDALQIPSYVVIKENKWDGKRYEGWHMPCNYTHGSDAGNQEYLDCANGVVYQKIGVSPSVTYFDPKNKERNERYCRDGEVATFSFENPITKKQKDTFVKCIGF